MESMKIEVCGSTVEVSLSYIISDRNRDYYSYTLSVDDEIIFEGKDFSPGACHDDEDMYMGLLGFLTLRKGDTDAEYFKDYTQAQIDFTNSALCEELSYLVHSYGDSDSEYYGVPFWVE